MALAKDGDIVVQALIMNFKDALLTARERIGPRQKVASESLRVPAAQTFAGNKDMLVGAVGQL